MRAIPGFQDMALIDGVQPVYIFKKAFFLLFSLHVKLSEPSSESGKSVAAPRIPDARKLPMFVDNVLPTMLVHLGIVDLSRSLSDGLRAWAASKDALSSSTSTSPAQSVQQAAQTQTQGKEGTQNQNQKLEVIEGPNLSLSDAYVVRAASIDGGVAVVRRAKELAQSESAGEELRWLAELTEVDLGEFGFSSLGACGHV